MKCPFCAEAIQDAAILCRFCNARKEGEAWQAPAAPGPSTPPSKPGRPKGYFTLKTAAALFLVSAVLELATVTAAAPLFGAVRGGAFAIAYHLLYVAVFVGLGVGIWVGQRWGYLAVFAGTAFYTLDKALFVLDEAAQRAYLEVSGASQLRGLGLGPDMTDVLLQVVVMVNVSLVLCWWLFALYVRGRRAYFHPDEPSDVAA